MSQVTISGNAGGTGIFTIASPATNTNRTLTLPDNTGTILTTGTAGVPVNGPAFSATVTTGQSVSNNTNTKINFTTEVFDSNGAYDASNSRFTPQVAGYYQINIVVTFDNGANGTINSAWVAKNGSPACRSWFPSVTGQYCGAQVSAVIYLNGSTDYIEAYAFQNTGSSKTTLTGTDSGFSGALVRAA